MAKTHLICTQDYEIIVPGETVSTGVYLPARRFLTCRGDTTIARTKQEAKNLLKTGKWIVDTRKDRS